MKACVAWVFEQNGGAWHVVNAANGDLLFAADSAEAARHWCQLHGWYLSKIVPRGQGQGGSQWI